jgi:hypothetical protein
MLAWIFISALFIVVKKLQIAVFMNNWIFKLIYLQVLLYYNYTHRHTRHFKVIMKIYMIIQVPTYGTERCHEWISWLVYKVDSGCYTVGHNFMIHLWFKIKYTYQCISNGFLWVMW